MQKIELLSNLGKFSSLSLPLLSEKPGPPPPSFLTGNIQEGIWLFFLPMFYYGKGGSVLSDGRIPMGLKIQGVSFTVASEHRGSERAGSKAP